VTVFSTAKKPMASCTCPLDFQQYAHFGAPQSL